MKMRTITVQRTIAAPREAVFDWLATASNYTSARLIRSAKLTRPGDEAPWGTGARREVSGGLIWFDEEIVAYDPPRSFEYRIRRSRPAMRHDHGRLDFEEVEGGTRVVWTSTFGITVPVVGGPLTMALAPVGAVGFAGLLRDAERALVG